MDRRTKNVEIFKDSVKLMNGSSRLQQAIKESVNKQKLYLETEEIAVPENKGLRAVRLWFQRREVLRRHLLMQEQVRRLRYLILHLPQIPVVA